MGQVRFATVGTSMITGMFIEGLSQVDEAVYVGSFSRDAEKAEAYTKEHGGERAFTSIDEVACAHDVDAVYVASPNALHHDQAVTFVKAGKHVLVEKSMCSNRREAADLFHWAENSEVVAMEAMRSVHDPSMAAIREALPKLGRVRSVCLRFGKRSSRYDDVLAGRHTNIFDPNMATGALMDLGVYCVEPLIELFGIPSDTRCFSSLLNDEIDLCGAILADYDDMVAEIAYSKITNDLMCSQVEGELGTMTIDHISGPRHVTIAYLDGTVEDLDIVAEDISHPDYENNMAYEIRDFCSAVSGTLDISHFQRLTLASLAVQDEARYQCGIQFPADEQE
ncbi:MAG: Gfo/Idh/MocA family oxidoreductase [Atopobiaceae bacterium]|nr:Gfo/Idh/MocA family oxidoreductase [Atopobiaceae bacterium]MCI2173095.1 Gfo/Idh/MocA family oxidoreductase [Atopobiaceae bacterium]MCI2208188.1 Gfo/Idh/MocA family oxidoreductase [Atopobiaceae bacterium]